MLVDFKYPARLCLCIEGVQRVSLTELNADANPILVEVHLVLLVQMNLPSAADVAEVSAKGLIDTTHQSLQRLQPLPLLSHKHTQREKERLSRCFNSKQVISLVMIRGGLSRQSYLDFINFLLGAL